MKDVDMPGVENPATATELPTTNTPKNNFVEEQKAVLAAALERAKQLRAAKDYTGAYDIVRGIRNIAIAVPALNSFPLENAKDIIEISEYGAIWALTEVAIATGIQNPAIKEYYKKEVFPLLTGIMGKDPETNYDLISKLVDSANGDEEMIEQLHDVYRPTLQKLITEQNNEKVIAILKCLTSYHPHDLVIMAKHVALERSGADERLFFIPEDGKQCLRYVFKDAHKTYDQNPGNQRSSMPVDVLADFTNGSLTKQEAQARIEQQTGKWTLVI